MLEPKENEEKKEEKAAKKKTLAEEKKEAKELLEEIKKEKADLEVMIEKAIQLKAEEEVAGNAEAGTARKEESEDAKITREANEFLKGTGMNI